MTSLVTTQSWHRSPETNQEIYEAARLLKTRRWKTKEPGSVQTMKKQKKTKQLLTENPKDYLMWKCILPQHALKTALLSKWLVQPEVAERKQRANGRGFTSWRCGDKVWCRSDALTSKKRVDWALTCLLHGLGRPAIIPTFKWLLCLQRSNKIKVSVWTTIIVFLFQGPFLCEVSDRLL